MRQRNTFRAKVLETLEGRRLMSGVPDFQFPDLGFYLAQLNRQYATAPAPTPGGATTGSNTNPPPQAQVLIPPPSPGFIDGRVKFTRADVNRLDSAADAFGVAYTSGQHPNQDAAAVSAFKASLDAFDKTVSQEDHLPAGSTTNLVEPLLNGVPLTKFEVNTLEYAIDRFASAETFGRDGMSNNSAALAGLESSMNLLIGGHPRPSAPAKS